MNTNTQAPFPNLFNAAREMIAEREQALIEQEIAQVEAGWSTR